ncbi:MAG TPA: hypothetical protein VFR60_03460 [Sphingomicrobium sp.]|nr:hypothetical protein [Sphingomicrobium sp.]
MEDDLAAKLLMLAIIGAVIVPDFAQALQEPAPSEKVVRICRKSETRTGTRIRTGRKCRTAEEWQKEDEEKARVPLSLTVTEGQNDGHPPQRPQ